jgi:DNA-binding CsgD family transcriptional regulator
MLAIVAKGERRRVYLDPDLEAVPHAAIGGGNRRRDYGSVRLSQRDGILLRLIAEQYAISIDQLARMIGRSHRTGRWLRDRWRQADWVESRQLTSGGPSFIWLTRQGTRIAQSPYRTWQPNAGLIGHIEAVAELRIGFANLVAADLQGNRAEGRAG